MGKCSASVYGKMLSFSMMDCSTGHLSPGTKAWLDDPVMQKKHGFMARDTGYAISSYLGSESVWTDHRYLPDDLLHVLRYAHANKMDWVLFDVDAEKDLNLPWYYENGGPSSVQIPKDMNEDIFGCNKEPLVKAIDPEKITPKELVVSGDQELEDENYTIPEDQGVWLTVAGASVRIKDMQGDLAVTVFSDGHEMDPEIARIDISADEIENARKYGEAGNEGPDL